MEGADATDVAYEEAEPADGGVFAILLDLSFFDGFFSFS